MERSSFSRIAIAVVVGVFLMGTFLWRQYQLSQRFDTIGVVEGFYGTPWTHDARLDVIRFMGEVGMDSYIYAPKDDPLHRQRWREQYEGDELIRFQELVEVSEESGVELVYAISPGLSIRYSSEEDYIALKEKLFSMSILGVSQFALFLDDVPEQLQHPEDIEKYNSLSQAHIELINRLHQDLQTVDATLIVCPTTYTTAWGSKEYIRELGKGVNQDIPLFWTGDDVAIGEITAQQASSWGELIGRKPWIWDNFPVNDFEQWRPIVGPIIGRSLDLSSEAGALFANPMDKPYLSMISLYTVAKYGGNPYGYDPEQAWQDALIHVAGTEGARAIRPIMMLFKDYGWTDNVFTPIYTPGKSFNINSVRDALTLMEEQLVILKSDQYSQNEYIQNILPELEPYINKIRIDYDAMVLNPLYLPDAEGFLTYQNEREAVFTTQRPATLDGNLSEWVSSEFVKLNSSRVDDSGRVSVAYRYDRNNLYIGVNINTNFITSTSDTSWVGGDQLLIVMDYTPEMSDTWVQPQDLVWLVRPPDDSGSLTQRKGSMVLTPFSQRGISDITMRSISSFFSHYIKPLDESLVAVAESARATGRRTDQGYQLELMIPVGNLDSIRLNLSVNDIHQHDGVQRASNFIFSRRPYIGNVYTYPEIIFR
jgi:hypothetical protein